jgi:integrase
MRTSDFRYWRRSAEDFLAITLRDAFLSGWGVDREVATDLSKVFKPPSRTFSPALEYGKDCRSKAALEAEEVWTIRVRLQLEQRKRDLAMFNLAIDSKLRGCDLVRIGLDDVCIGGRVRDRATVIQKKTGRPVQFEITDQTRIAIQAWINVLQLKTGKYIFPSRLIGREHLSIRQ